MAFEKQLEQLEQKIAWSQAQGGPEKVARQHERGRLTARERIARLVDKGSFFEIGRFSHSDMPGMEEKTPSDSKISGYAKIEGRDVIVIANDFTVLAATSSRNAGKREGELKLVAAKRGLPLIYLGEAGGARMPDIMGSRGLASFGGGGYDTFFHAMTRVRHAPMVTTIMGECYGMPTWMACLSDFVVQVKGSAMGVSGPRVLGDAISETVTDEELGGWKVHAQITGMADAVAEDEDDCLALVRRYLGYMPSHTGQLPPRAATPRGAGADMDKVLDILPEKSNRAYDMGRILSCVVDPGSLFPLKDNFAKMVITALARVDGRVVGIVANQPYFNAGAMNTDGIDKVISFLVLCDSFNIPLVFFHDTPGFLVGKEAERKRVAARVMNFMNALGLITVPKISIIVRKTFGMAYWNMAGAGCATDFHVAWPTAQMSFVDPRIAASVVFGDKHERGSQQWEEAVSRMEEDASPFAAAGHGFLHDVIDPRATRDYIVKALGLTQDTRLGGIGEHKLANWPTKY